MSINFIRAPHRRELISIAIEWLEQNKRIALVTLVNVEGNTPYPIGTQMLVSDDGLFVGQITGGCAETAIAEQAVDAIQRKRSCTQRYGLNSPFFDIRLPCGSGIDVYVDVSKTLAGYRELQRALDDRRIAADRFSTGLGTFNKRYIPNQRLVFVGQGPILVACSKIALESGFDVLCIAQNEDTVVRLGRAELASLPLERCPPLETLCDKFTGLVSLFHEHEYEAVLLAQALASDAFYVGALGSRRTHSLRLEALSEMGLPDKALLEICGPVGVNIRAETPSQIAVSIVAQAIGKLNETLELSDA